jgi:hypothetical protein
MYPNWDFWFENKPSGNPELSCSSTSFRVAIKREEIIQTKITTSCQEIKKSQKIPLLGACHGEIVFSR